MMADELDKTLRQWAAAQIGRHGAYVAPEDRDTGPGSHPISRAREFAPMTRSRAAARIAGRDGSDRRRTMAAVVAIKGLHLIPMAFCDPVRCVETRHSGPMQSVDQGIPTELKRVDRAVMDLYRIDTFKGLCVRLEYTGFGYQSDRAIEVGKALGAPVTLRQYRDGLRAGRQWLMGRLAA